MNNLSLIRRLASIAAFLFVLAVLVGYCNALQLHGNLNYSSQGRSSPSAKAKLPLLTHAITTAGTQSTNAVNKRCVGEEKATVSNRRNALTSLTFGLVSAAGGSAATTPLWPANAFTNKISTKYDDRPKRRGPKPQDLGVGKRTTVDGYDEYVGLKACGPAPNCFSSTISVEDDADHSIPTWIYPKDHDKEKAMSDLLEVIQSYQPGQNGVDGGGFEIQKTNDTNQGYIYVQFESLKNGYIDDVEFAIIDSDSYPERSVQIRSSSRIGYLDYGVNAKRVNAIAEQLRTKYGWDAIGVETKSHPFYYSENQDNR